MVPASRILRTEYVIEPIRHMPWRFALLCCCLLPVHLLAGIESLRFTRYGVDQGLASSMVRAVIQDRRGFLWVGTVHGLNRYDGHHFRSYVHQPHNALSLSDNEIFCLAEDEDGILWIGTGQGLNRFEPRFERFQRHEPAANRVDPLSAGVISALYPGAEKILWVGTRDSGLFRMDRDRDQILAHAREPKNPGSLADNWVRCILEDRRGRLWVGTSRGLNLADTPRAATLSFRNPLAAGAPELGAVNAVLETESGALWVAHGARGHQADPG